jgi:hypothetical protein
MAFGRWLAQDRDFTTPGRDSLSRELPRLIILQEMESLAPQQPLPRDAYFDGIQVMVGRDREGDPSGLFLSAKGGHNAESHNHNDVGNFIVFIDGLPVIVDAGVETYTKKTFSPQRYEIWTMQSAYHSLLPTFDGVQQLPGMEYKATDVAYRFDQDTAQFTLDIAKAYPESAGLESLQRTFTLKRGLEVEIIDIVVLNKDVDEINLSVLTPCDVNIDTDGAIKFLPRQFASEGTSGDALFRYDGTRFTVHVERVPIRDTRMGSVWGNFLNRLVFTCCTPAQNDTWTWAVSKP